MNKKTIKIGDEVYVPTHIEFQHVSKGAVITPAIERTIKARITTVVEILQDECEDEHFNPVMTYTYVMKNGEYLQREHFQWRKSS